MLGDIAPLKEMVAVSKAARRDGAGRRGAFGWASSARNGRGVVRGSRASRTTSISSSAPSPRSVGTVGGFFVSNHPKFEILRLVCRPYVFTASLPPSVVATAATSIRKLMHGQQQARPSLGESASASTRACKALGFTLATEEPQSAIIAVIMPDLEQGAAMWQALLAEGLYVNMARPPATPAGMYLLRCSLCAEHSDEQVGEILAMFESAGKATGVDRLPAPASVNLHG